jgi:hypothetical protein
LKAWLGQSPLTDPRAVFSSLAFHGVLLLVASAAALSAIVQRDVDRRQALRGELDPVDNRAKGEEDGGGSPGPLGDQRLAAALATLAPPTTTPDGGAARPPAADALLSEIIPATTAPADAIQQALPGPQTSSLGLLTGPGSGGGGGSGGGAGGGTGRGIGPGTEFFGAREHASSFVYVIDCSGSMATRGSLDVAKRELSASLHQLPPDAQFGVIFYNLRATVFSDPQGRKGLMAATAVNKERVGHQLLLVVPDGGTDHLIALRTALAIHPEVIFFLTDADLMTQTDAQTIIAEAGKTRIQAVQFGTGYEIASTTNPLRRLTSSTGGTYRYIDVSGFPKAR